jgi:hypothetical protein
MQYTTRTTNITKVHRGIASIVLISQLLTSCGGTARELRTDLTVPLPSPSASLPEPVLSSDRETREESNTSAAATLPEPALPPDMETREESTLIEVRYLNLAGGEGSIQVDLAHTSVAEFLERIKQKERLVDAGCRLVDARDEVYNEADTRLLGAILDRRTIAEEALTIVKVSNVTIAQALLGANYLGEEAWRKLGIAGEIELPTVSDKLLSEVKRLQIRGEQPLLLLDLGKSIEEIEGLCKAKNITAISTKYGGDAKIREEAFYQAPDTDCPRWLLLPGSDHGVLPGSRDKTYANQVTHMQANYPGYEVGGARELLTLSMLKYAKDGTMLFPDNPYTYGRCKEEYQTGDWQGRRLLLGEISSSAYFGLVFYFDDDGYGYDYSGFFARLALPSPSTKRP